MQNIWKRFFNQINLKMIIIFAVQFIIFPSHVTFEYMSEYAFIWLWIFSQTYICIFLNNDSECCIKEGQLKDYNVTWSAKQ